MPEPDRRVTFALLLNCGRACPVASLGERSHVVASCIAVEKKDLSTGHSTSLAKCSPLQIVGRLNLEEERIRGRCGSGGYIDAQALGSSTRSAVFRSLRLDKASWSKSDRVLLGYFTSVPRPSATRAMVEIMMSEVWRRVQCRTLRRLRVVICE